MSGDRRWWILGGIIFVLAFRVAVVATFHVPGGDGIQYYKIAQELRRAGRFAYAPPPVEASYSRLPGYPVFLAYAVAWKPISNELNSLRATLWNVVFDLGTALIVFLIIRQRGLSRKTGLIALFVTLLFPSLIVMSCYAMTESLSTFLATLELFFILKALNDRPLLWAGLAGVVAGAAQLVRADAVTVAPALLLALLLVELPWRRRLISIAVFTICAAAVFSPWPIRNMQRFGAPHFAACAWRTMDGDPLPTGPVEWARSWSSSTPGEAWFDLMFANNSPMELARPNVILPAMYDDEVEHQEVLRIMTRYNQERVTPAVDAMFRNLAERRRGAHPFRFYVTLPLMRALRLWSPLPPWEEPFRVRWLGQPKARPVLDVADVLLFIAALGGVIVLCRRGRHSHERVTAAVLGCCIVTRTLLYSMAIPHQTTGRYLVEVVPLLILFAAVGVARLNANANE